MGVGKSSSPIGIMGLPSSVLEQHASVGVHLDQPPTISHNALQVRALFQIQWHLLLEECHEAAAAPRPHHSASDLSQELKNWIVCSRKLASNSALVELKNAGLPQPVMTTSKYSSHSSLFSPPTCARCALSPSQQVRQQLCRGG